jgi:hypothetical protein
LSIKKDQLFTNRKISTMKKILMALTLIAIAHYSAEAQNQNYKVCKYNSGYATCGHEKATAGQEQVNAMPAPYAVMPVATIQPAAPLAQPVPFMPQTGYTYYDKLVNYLDHPKHHVIVYSDSMDAPYKGEDSRQNDGVAKNEYRNLNYQIATTDLPPSTGSFTK